MGTGARDPGAGRSETVEDRSRRRRDRFSIVEDGFAPDEVLDYVAHLRRCLLDRDAPPPAAGPDALDEARRRAEQVVGEARAEAARARREARRALAAATDHEVLSVRLEQVGLDPTLAHGDVAAICAGARTRAVALVEEARVRAARRARVAPRPSAPPVLLETAEAEAGALLEEAEAAAEEVLDAAAGDAEVVLEAGRRQARDRRDEVRRGVEVLRDRTEAEVAEVEGQVAAVLARAAQIRTDAEQRAAEVRLAGHARAAERGAQVLASGRYELDRLQRRTETTRVHLRALAEGAGRLVPPDRTGPGDGASSGGRGGRPGRP